MQLAPQLTNAEVYGNNNTTVLRCFCRVVFFCTLESAAKQLCRWRFCGLYGSMLQGLHHLHRRHATGCNQLARRKRFCSTVELLFVLCVECFAKFSTLLLHFLCILLCPAPQQNEGNHLAYQNIPPVSGCLFYRLEGSHFVHRNIPLERASFRWLFSLLVVNFATA